MKTSHALDVHFPSEESVAARLIARIDDFAPHAIHELGPDDAPLWRVFFDNGIARDDAAQVLAAEFGPSLRCETVDVDDEDWAARSQSGLRAVRVGRIVVAPPWDTAAAGSGLQARGSGLQAPGAGRGEILIVIEPSMGFGTGHHETTRLCLELLQTTVVVDREVLDVGTGSGVLAIAAAFLGSRLVRAIDIDQDALASARENVALNDPALVASGSTIELSTRSIREGAAPADLVLANLTGGLLISSAGALRAAVRAGGALLASGFQRHEADAVLAALGSHATGIDRRREGEWEAALIRF